MHQTKRQSGSSILEILQYIMFLGLAFIGLSLLDGEQNRKINELSTRPPKVSLADRELADTYAKKPPPEVVPLGRYLATRAIDGDEYTITLYFPGGDTVFAEAKKPRSWFRKDISFSGSAPYTFTGSVMKFGPVTGDMIFFPETGEPITFNGPAQFVLHSDREDLTFKRVDPNSSEPEASPSAAASQQHKATGLKDREQSIGQ